MRSIRGIERPSEWSDGINMDLNPLQADPLFEFIDKKSFWKLIIFFKMGPLHPIFKRPKLWKAGEASNG